MTAPTTTTPLSDLILAALTTSVTIDGHCVMLRPRYTDDTHGAITVAAERYEFTELGSGELVVSTTEEVQLFLSPVAPVITVTPTQPPVPPVAETSAPVEPDPTVTWMPAVPATDPMVSTP